MIRRQAAEAFLATLVLGLIGIIAVAVQEPILAPSLGSAVFVQVTTPQTSAARAWNTAGGQFAGMIGGFAGVFVTGVTTLPAFFGDHRLIALRVLALVIATFLTIVTQQICRCVSPAGGATAIIVAFGEESASWLGVQHLLAGILLVTLLGEAARWLVLKVQAPPNNDKARAKP